MNRESPSISVLISADDHPPSPQKVIRAFFSQTADPADFEVIFIDVQDRPDFRAVLEHYRGQHPQGPHFVYRVLPGASRACCNNEALRLARGSILLFFADDFLAGPGMVAAHMAFHRQNPGTENVGVGAGILSTGTGSNSLYRWLEQSGQLFGVPMSEDMQSIPDDFFYIANSSVKRAMIERCGTFDEDFPFHCWDDFDMGRRLRAQGMVSALVPDAQAEHDHPITLKARAVAMVKSGYSARIYRRKYPGQWLDCYRITEKTQWYYLWRAVRRGLKYLLSRRERYLMDYYRAILDAAFRRGYYRAVHYVQ